MSGVPRDAVRSSPPPLTTHDDDDDDDDVTAFFAQMLDAAAPVAGAAAGDASAARQDGAERIIAFALRAWNHNSLALALLHAATTSVQLFNTGDWKADLVGPRDGGLA